MARLFYSKKYDNAHVGVTNQFFYQLSAVVFYTKLTLVDSINITQFSEVLGSLLSKDAGYV